jgi:hypothetical protein
VRFKTTQTDYLSLNRPAAVKSEDLPIAGAFTVPIHSNKGRARVIR